MRAVVFDHFGPPEVIHIAELPVPTPGPGEVVVKVAAATVNPTDVMMRTGQQATSMTELRPPYIAGMEFSGYVHALGGASSRFTQGRSVMGIVNPRRPEGGAHAEYVRVPEASIVATPDGLDIVGAATIPMNGLTGRMVLQALELSSGATLLVTGGAGALGGYVIQLARDAGLVVIADGKEQDRELLTRLGANEVVPRGEEMAAAVRARHPDGVDALADAALVGDTAASLARKGGTVVSVRAKQVYTVPGVNIKSIAVLREATNTEGLEWVAERARRNVLIPRVAHLIEMSRAEEAHRLVEQGGLRGRVVLIP